MLFSKLKDAAEFALLWGIKIGGTILIIAALNLAWMGDYRAVREGAAHGEAAYQVILRVQQQQAAQQQPPH